jgi:hypothetical protein
MFRLSIGIENGLQDEESESSSFLDVKIDAKKIVLMAQFCLSSLNSTVLWIMDTYTKMWSAATFACEEWDEGKRASRRQGMMLCDAMRNTGTYVVAYYRVNETPAMTRSYESDVVPSPCSPRRRLKVEYPIWNLEGGILQIARLTRPSIN